MDNPEYRKSSYSSAQGNCVEVATLPDGTHLVRDTKNRDGGTLQFTAEEWRAFTDEIKAG